MTTGRKPVTHLAAMGLPTGQDAVWAAIRALSPAGEVFTRADLQGRLIPAQGRTTISRTTLRNYLSRLVAAGIVGVAEGGIVGQSEAGYQLVTDPGPETPRLRRDGTLVLVGAGHAAMWRTAKILNEFTLTDLVKLGTTEEVVLTRDHAKYYLGMLAKAGYVAIQRGAGREPARYRMLKTRNTGPKPPVVQRLHRVYDANLNKVVWTGEPEVVE